MHARAQVAEFLQGNCSNPDAAAALGLSAAEAASMLPLKPRQCVVVVHDSFLMSNGGECWLDNLYLKLSRKAVKPRASFIAAGASGDAGYQEVSPSSLYVTNITLQSDFRGKAGGIVLYEDNSNLFLQGADSFVQSCPCRKIHSSEAFSAGLCLRQRGTATLPLVGTRSSETARIRSRRPAPAQLPRHRNRTIPRRFGGLGPTILLPGQLFPCCEASMRLSCRLCPDA